MKKYLLCFAVALVMLCSCSSSVRRGDVITLKEDIIGADSKEHLVEVKRYAKSRDDENYMRMYYLGYAFRLEKGKTVTVLLSGGKITSVIYDNKERYVEVKDLL